MTRVDKMVIEPRGRQYERFRQAVASEVLPAALVDLDAFERNIDRLLLPLRAAGKKLRVATKSLRCPALIERVLSRAAETVSGLMTYTAQETAFLAARGHKDLLLAYPTVRGADLSALVEARKAGARAAVVVDCEEQLDALERAAEAAGTRLDFLIELDVSYRPIPSLHLGVRRSPLRSVEDAVALARRGTKSGRLELRGVMAYEAQIAGLTDRNPFSTLTNPARRLIKLGSRGSVASARRSLVDALRAAGFPPQVVNGGGTGSAAWTASDPAVTEVAVGSGFLDSLLFDYYADLALEPAAFFALQVTRRPGPGLVTCHGGGYVASGEAGPDKLPLPALPEGLALLPHEAAGEVQTPLRVPPGVSIALGDPVFFRHAKAGELAEHFNEYVLVRGDRVEAREPTYRGLGKAFLG